MKKQLFYKLGGLIYALRWFIISFWIISLLVCIPVLIEMIPPFKTTGFTDETAESTRIQGYIDKKLGYNKNNKFIVIYHSPDLSVDDARFNNKIKQSLAKLKNFPIATEIIYPVDNKKQRSKDKHTAYAVIMVKNSEALTGDKLNQFINLIKKPSNMTIEIGGEAVFVKEINRQTQNDLYRVDYIATPFAIITLLLVFGSVIAALLPVLLGGGCALIILSSLFVIGEYCLLSAYTLNIALLLGLCLSLDYALFVISRFREELSSHPDNIQEAIRMTEATAGKAVFFSGLAVMVSLSALFLFPINILFSMAVGGMAAVFVAVIAATIILPAILAVLKQRINLLSLPFFNKNTGLHFSLWRWLAQVVVSRPLVIFFPILIFLLLLGYPFLSAKFGISDYRITPKASSSRVFFDTYATKFNIKELMPIVLLVQSSQNVSILSKKNISTLYDFVQKLKDDPGIKKTLGIISSNSKTTKDQYKNLYAYPRTSLSTASEKLLNTTTRSSLTVLNVISAYGSNASQTTDLIYRLKKLKIGNNLTLSLTGIPVSNLDVLERISKILPYALLWIIVCSYLILLLLLRSLFLPLKAILMNLLSLCACYGALVLVFQDGYLATFLNFEPQGMLDISLLVIIFCALFGFSMDYEVFLLTRIKEAYQLTGDNKKSIIFGIEKSSRIITSAALIVIIICGSFLVADILMVKAFGLGIAVAIFVDAFLIRSLLVPSTMALLAKWNWYLPQWLDRILPKI